VIAGFWGAANVWGGEYAVLNTGFRLHAERHAVSGQTVMLFDKDGAFTEIPGSSIAGFEPDELPPAGIGERIPENADRAAPSPRNAPALSSVVENAARTYGIHPALISSVIAAESGFNASAVSPKGALGLMQLMPSTAREFGVRNPQDAAQNVAGGTAYLKQLLERYAGFQNQLERTLAAYNAGPAKVDRYGGLPPYRETVDFVLRVSARLRRLAGTRTRN
jgi:soluble lytic murein transglycosylase-like protein